MYREINKRKTNFIFVAVSFVVLALVTYFVLKLLPVVQLIRDIALMASLVAFVFVLIKSFVAEYEYELNDRQIIFRMYLGGRVRSEITADICDLILFCKADDDRLNDFKVSVKTMCVFSNRKFAALFKDNGNFVKVVFAPSKNLVTLIEDSIKTLCGEE